MIREGYAGIKAKAGTCEACVWGRGKHAEGCEREISGISLLRMWQGHDPAGDSPDLDSAINQLNSILGARACR